MKDKSQIFNKKIILALVPVLILLLLLCIPSSTAAYSPTLAGHWHRLNPDQNNDTPEHEVLTCGGYTDWRCLYDKQPELRLGFEFPPDGTYGWFYGQNVDCPEAWGGFCANVVSTVEGEITYYYPDGLVDTKDQYLVLAENSSGQVFYMTIPVGDSLYFCPWYRSFNEALEISNFEPPFDGENWPDMDCFPMTGF
jgi:hypothetical protein